LTSEDDFNGRIQRYVLDPAGQLLELAEADGRSTVFAYNTRGDVTERRSSGGTVVTFGYDERGFLKSTANAQCTVEYTRDLTGRVLAETVNGRTMIYEYDILGRCTRRVTPGGIVSGWTYDATGHPLALAATAGSLSIGYDDLGRETTRYLGADVAVTQAWDTRDRLTGQAVWASAVSGQTPAATADYRNVSQRAYSYDATGLVSGIVDSATGNRAIRVTSAGRVSAVTGENWTERYVYGGFASYRQGSVVALAA
jgi:YD repeat-containing protein